MGDHALIPSKSRDTKKTSRHVGRKTFLAMEETVRARGNYTLEMLAGLPEGGGRADRRAEPNNSTISSLIPPARGRILSKISTVCK